MQKSIYKLINFLEFESVLGLTSGPLFETCSILRVLTGVKQLFKTEIDSKQLMVKIYAEEKIKYSID